MARNRRQIQLPRCNCGRVSIIKTSWTDKNPSRRFASCSQYQGEGCDFFEWLDPEICERASNVIPGLLRRIRSMELDIDLGNEKMKNLEEKIQDLSMANHKLCAENVRLKLRMKWLLFVIGLFCVVYFSSVFSIDDKDDLEFRQRAIGNL